MKTTTIKPGLLVSLKTSTGGGVTYRRTDLVKEGDRIAKWETEREISDPEEYKLAGTTRSQAAGMIRAVCATTNFGLLCPEENEAALDAAVEKARALCQAFNETAVYTRVTVFVLKGRIASTDEEAARAIGDDVAQLIREMGEAIDKLDPKAIRDAASRARDMSLMLTEDKAALVTGAIAQARKAAREIVQRIEKDGEAAAIVLKDIQRGSIEKARIAFLDMDDAAPAAEGSALPAVELQRFADLAPEPVVAEDVLREIVEEDAPAAAAGEKAVA